MNTEEMTEEEFDREVARAINRIEPCIRMMMVRSMERNSVEFSINVAMDICTTVIAMSMCSVKMSGADSKHFLRTVLSEIMRKTELIMEQNKNTHLH